MASSAGGLGGASPPSLMEILATKGKCLTKSRVGSEAYKKVEPIPLPASTLGMVCHNAQDLSAVGLANEFVRHVRRVFVTLQDMMHRQGMQFHASSEHKLESLKELDAHVKKQMAESKIEDEEEEEESREANTYARALSSTWVHAQTLRRKQRRKRAREEDEDLLFLLRVYCFPHKRNRVGDWRAFLETIKAGGCSRVLLIVADMTLYTQTEIKTTTGVTVANGQPLQVEVFTFPELILNRLKCHIVPEYRILSPTEAEAALTAAHLRKNQLPPIFEDEIIVRYLHAPIGSIVHVKIPCQSGYWVYLYEVRKLIIDTDGGLAPPKPPSVGETVD